MVLSAFESTFMRETIGSSAKSSSSSASNLEDSAKNARLRRSRSASAISRSCPKAAAAAPASIEFLNKRDNPLFCSSETSSPESEAPAANLKSSGVVSSIRRGGSVSRSSMDGNQSVGSRNQSAQSFSRVFSGRHLRSCSTEHCCYFEREVEKENGERLSSCIKGNGEDCYMFNQRENLQRWTSCRTLPDSCTAVNASSWQDGISTSSLSEVEETTVGVHGHHLAGGAVDSIYEAVRSEVQRAVSEMQSDLENAIWGKNYTMHSSNGNLETVELVTDIRIEYETKLKESHERARKLRADLAVEEQRELEISRMLKKIIPIERSTAQKSLTGRKSSVDRLHMSRRLAEDAMNYFDECVSISTFDSSDFSSVEDQQPSSVGVISHVDCAVPGTSNGNIHTHKELENENHCNSNEISSSGPMEAFESHDLRNYIKKFEKKSNESSEHIEEISRFSFDDYDLYNSAESLLQELIILRNRIESGSLLLCCNIRNF